MLLLFTFAHTISFIRFYRVCFDLFFCFYRAAVLSIIALSVLLMYCHVGWFDCILSEINDDDDDDENI